MPQTIKSLNDTARALLDAMPGAIKPDSVLPDSVLRSERDAAINAASRAVADATTPAGWVAALNSYARCRYGIEAIR